MRVRMITSMSGEACDLPYGTELSVADEYAPDRRVLDRKTADRWLLHGVVELLPGEEREDEPPTPPMVETSVIERAHTADLGSVRRGRKHR